MVAAHAAPEQRTALRGGLVRLSRYRWWVVGAVLTVLLVLVVGGYGLGWRWTGLSASVTLWDWLQALALPIALGSTPLLLTHRRRLRRTHYLALGIALGLFAALVVAGYLLPMRWTGFTGNTLWDWLELLLLPLVIATTSLWSTSALVHRPYITIVLAVVVLFLVLVISGYEVPLTWTGFRGNTAWDWIKLLLVPTLVPTVLVPFVTERLRDGLGVAEAGPAAPGR